MKNLDSGSGFCPNEACARPQLGRARFGAGPGRRLAAIGMAVCLLASPSIALAGDHTAEVSKESGMGAAAALTSLVYSPVKLVYALGGLVVGSLAWVFTAGDTNVADKVYVRSLRGTYVITPEILRGEEELVFIGRDPSVMPVEQPKAIATGPVASGPLESTAPSESYSADAYGDVGW
ncbi:MAG: hypothetical protein R3F35_02725 [Myxococcota bacterium]